MPDELSAQQKVDVLQFHLGQQPQVECPLVHRFTPGLYTREVFVPKGTLAISRVHKTEHPFAVLSGRATVWTEEGGVVTVCAGHLGITSPGTRRMVYAVEDLRWVTFHPTTETDLAKLQEELTSTPDVSYIAGWGEAQALLRRLGAAELPEAPV